ncbi:MXAN_6640 family putative metalloprotease [Nocardioides sp. CPCC 205120]|uniref:MXAN_6640 family putative metalloprotease n=1 Tax=Nocardioides sp. CPCC 205120 TaxID=3406462 RepID=UPI003B500DBA
MLKRARPWSLAAVVVSVAAMGVLPAHPVAAEPADSRLAPASATAGTDDPVPLPSDPDDITADQAARTLIRARAAVDGDLQALPATGAAESPTLALRDLYRAKPRLGGGDLDAAERILARPTDGAADPGGDGYPAGAPVSTGCSANVCVHYVKVGEGAATDAWAYQTLKTMQSVWDFETRTQLFRGPAADGTRGGSSKFDVYLTELTSQDLYGYCAPEEQADAAGMRATSYCVLDNDYVGYQRSPLDSLKVTAAHEFFHAVQFNYDVHEDAWLYEATATWMEEQYAPSVNDNQQYLPAGQLGDPRIPMDEFGENSYGNWVFFEYLTKRYGFRIVRTTWEAAAGATGTDYHSLLALKFALYYSRDTAGARGEYGQEYAGFAAANHLPHTFYPDGAAYPSTPPRNSVPFRMAPGSVRNSMEVTIPQQTTASYRIDPWRLNDGNRHRLVLQFSTPPSATTPGAYVTVFQSNGRTQRIPVRMNGGTNAVVVPVSPAVSRVYLTLANASSRMRCGLETERACSGTPVDDGVRVIWNARIQRY